MNALFGSYSEKKEVKNMGFCYALLKGRGGAGGYIREEGNQREVSVRDLPPGACCTLYVNQNGEYRLCGTETADGCGNARWKAPKEGALFLTSGDKVLLWDGGDEAYLRASAWLDSQNAESAEKGEPGKEKNTKTPQKTEALSAETLEACMMCAQDNDDQAEASIYPFESFPPAQAEKKIIKENPPEQAYILRPAGTGEPVDTLPERQRR